MLFPYDTLLQEFEATIPPMVQILVPGSRTANHFPKTRHIPPADNELFWTLCAIDCARYAYQENFSSRRGTHPFLVNDDEDDSVLCIYNNNPYKRGPHFRDDETRRFRRWLRSENIKELAYSTFPESGDGAGYTYAMLVDVPEGDTATLTRITESLQREIRTTMNLLENHA